MFIQYIIKKSFDYVIIDYTVKSINKDCKTFFLENLFNCLKNTHNKTYNFCFTEKKTKNILSLKHIIFFKDILWVIFKVKTLKKNLNVD